MAVRTYFFRACCASFHTHASFLAFFVCIFVLFHSCCSHALVFGKTLLHQLIMFYSHTEWYFPFFKRRNSLFGPSFVYQNQIKLNYFVTHLLFCIYFCWHHLPFLSLRSFLFLSAINSTICRFSVSILNGTWLLCMQ